MSRTKSPNCFLWACLIGVVLICAPVYATESIEQGQQWPQWSVHELTFTASGEYSNPYTQVALTVNFTGPGSLKQKVRGFWDGGQTFKARFTPTVTGEWFYATESSDAGLNGRKGSFRCTEPTNGSKGFLRRDAENPYHFIFDDGTRFFMFGQTYYALMRNALAGGGWQAAIENSRRAGMNKVRMQVFTPGQQSKTQPHPAASPFLRSGGELDRDRLDLAFWRKLDEVVRFMAEKDMLADLILFWSNPVSYGTDEQDHRYASYAVARYAAFPNVIWCVANEWNYTKKPRELFNELGKLIKAEDAWAVDVRPGRGKYVRALSVHQQTRQDFQFFDQTWLSHAIVQLGVRNQGKTFRDGNEWEANNAAEEGRTFRHGDEWGNYSIVLNYGRGMPVVNDEYGYIGEPEDQSVPKGADGKHPRYTRAKHRQTIWGIYTGGGYAAAGDKYDYEDGRPYFSSNWHDTEEYSDISRLIAFFTTKGVRYWRMAPRNELVKSGERVYVLAEPGKQYLIYAAAGGSFSVELMKGSYEVRRYDPRTGEDVALSQSKGGVESFTLPDEQDWVVYLRAKSTTSSLIAPPIRGAQTDYVFPLRASGNGRYLIDQRGQPFFYHADTAWTITKKLTPAEVAEYLDDRQKRGFTAIHIHAFSKEMGPLANRDGQQPFDPPDDILKPNEAYWRNVDGIIRAAEERDLLVVMSALWIRWGGKDREGWRYQLTERNARGYGRFLGRRYRGFKNLVWIVGGDANPIERTHAVAEIARGIHELAPQQLITVHNRPEYSSRAFYEGEPWLGINMAYSYHETYIHVLGEWNRLGRPCPIVLGESGYEEESNDQRGGDPHRMRRQAYGAILSGALGGHAFGQKHIWRFDEQWRAALDSPASRQMAHVKELFATRAWHKLVPDQFNQLVTDGRGFFGNEDYATAACATDGSLAIVYLPTPRTVTINSGHLRAPFTARWFDPASGSYQTIAGVSQRGKQQFTPRERNSAGAGDFALVIEAQAGGATGPRLSRR